MILSNSFYVIPIEIEKPVKKNKMPVPKIINVSDIKQEGMKPFITKYYILLLDRVIRVSKKNAYFSIIYTFHSINTYIKQIRQKLVTAYRYSYKSVSHSQ